MNDMKKTKAQLVEELGEMRRRVAVLESREAECEKLGETLTESEEKLRIIFESIADGVLVVDLNGKVVDVNDSTLRMKGYSDRSELVGRDGVSFVAERDRQRVVEAMGVAFKEGSFAPEEYTLLTRDGMELEVEASSSVLHDKQGRPVGLVCVEREISQRKRLEREREESRKKMETVFDSILDAVTVIDFKGTIIEANEAAARLGGYGSRQVLIGKNGFDFIAEGSRDEMLASFEELLRQGYTPPMEFKFKDRRGRELDAEATASVIRDSEGKIAGFVHVIRDIRERRRTEERLSSTAEKLSTVLQAMGDGVITIDVSGNITEANDAAVRMLEYGSKRKLVGRSALDTIAERDRRKFADVISQSIEAGETPGLLRFAMLTATGREFDAELSTSVLHDSRGNLNGLVGIVRDITERKREEEELNTFKEALENSTDAIGMSTPQGSHYYQNRAFEQLLGSVGESPLDTVYVDRKVGAGVFKTIMSGGQWTGEVQMYGKDRRILDIHLRAYANKDRNGDIISLVGIHTDITARKRAEKELERHRQKLESMVRERTAELMGAVEQLQAEVTERKRVEDELRESEEKYRSLVEDINEVVYMVDSDGVLLYISPSIESFAGYTPEELEGRNFAEFIYEEDLPRIIENYGSVLEGKAQANDYRIKTRSGELRWMRTSSRPVYVEGRVFGVNGVLMDITERRQMEDALRGSEEKLRLMFESIGDGIVVTDWLGNVTDANEAAASMMGYSSREEVIGRNGYEFIAEEDYSRAVEFSQRLFTMAQSGDTEYALLSKDGTRIDARVSASLMHDSEGKPAGIVAIAKDITERRQMEDALRESEEKLRLMFESITDGVTVTDLEGNFVDANDAAVRMLGCSAREELIGKAGIEFVAEGDREKAVRVMRQARKKGRARDIQFKLVRKGGLEFDSEWSVSLMRDGDGNPAGFIYVMRDITERKGLEKELRDSEERMRIMFESVGEGMLVCDLAGRIEKANQAALNISGYCMEDVIGRNVMDFMLPQERKKAEAERRSTLQAGINSKPIEYTLLGAKGRKIEAEFTASLMRDSEGNPVGLVGTARDISERKRMEDELRQSEEKLRRIFDSISEGIILTDLELNVVEANDAAVRLAGFDSREQFIGKNPMDFLLPEDRDRAVAPLPQAVEGSPVEQGEYRVRNHRGKEFDVQTGITTLHDSEGQLAGFVAVVDDLSEERRMQRALRESEEKLRSTFDSIGDGITVTDLMGTIIDVNEATLRIFGYSSKEEAIGLPGFDFIAEEDRSRAMEDMATIFDRGRTGPMEFIFVRRDGSEFHAESSNAVLHDGMGNAVGFVSVTRDITERKRMREALRESEEKLRTIFESINDGITVVDITGTIVDLNGAALDIFCFSSKEDAIGLTAFDFIAKKEHLRAMADFADIMDRGVVGPAEYTLVRSDGSEFHAETSNVVLRDGAGNAVGLVSVNRDVTERWQMREALEQSEARFRELFRHMSSGVAVYEAVGDGEDFIFNDLNAAGERISKLRKKKVVGRSVLEILPGIRDMGLFGVMQKVWKTGKPERLPASLYKDERAEGWRENYVYRLPSGEVVSVYDDVTERKRAEDALRESEGKLRFMFDSISDGFVLTDLNGEIIDVNEALARIAGFGHKEELIGRSGFKLLAGKDSREAAEDVGKALQAGEGGAKEYMLLRDDGCEVEVEATASFLRDAAGNPTGIISVVRDITERKRMDKELRDSEEKLRAMFESIDDGIVLLDMQGVILDVNSEAVRMLGSRSKEEVVGKSSWGFLGADDRGRTKDYIGKAVRKGEGGVIEYTLKDPEGSDIHVESRTAALHDSDGNAIGIVGVSRDITERKRMEGELRRSEEQMRFIFESIGDGIIVVDMGGNIVEVNQAALRMSGFEHKEDMIGRNAFDFVVDRDRARALEENVKNITEGHGSLVSYAAMDVYGREFEAEAVGAMIYDGVGEPAGFITAVRDVSERRRMEAALRESEEKLRTMFGAIRDGIIVTDMDDIIVDANEAALRMGKFGKGEELIGRSFVDLVVEKDRAIAAKAIVQALRAGRGAMMEYTYIDLQGGNYIGETSSALLYGTDGEPVGFVNVVRDTTERRRMEAALRESEEKLRVMFESIADGITVTDMQGCILDVNDEACRMLGCSSKGDLIGREYMDIIGREQVSKSARYIQRVIKGEPAGTIDYTLPDLKGGTLNIEATAAVLRDSAGQPTAIVGVARDVTERLRMEEKLRDREERMRTLLQSSPDFIMEADRDGKIVFINYTVPEMTVEQAVGTSLYDYISPESREVYIPALEHIFDTGEPATVETVGLGPGGRTSHYQTRFAPIERDGRVDSVLVIATDITERKQAEEALRESEGKLRIMFATIKDGLIITDMNGIVVDANDAAVELHGCARRDELIGRQGLELVADEDRQRVIEQSWEALSRGSGAMMEYSVLRGDGGRVAGEGSLTVLSDSRGNPTGIVVLTRDVSERKRMEEALRESEEMSRGMLESAATGVYMVQDRAFQYVSPLFADISGYTPDELLGTDPLGYVHPDDREMVRKAAIKSLKGKSSQPYEYRFMRKDGEVVWILEKVASIQYRDKPATIASFMDVTERRQALEELRRSEEKLRSFMDSATDYFTIWDSELNLVDLNEAAMRYPSVPRSRDIKKEDFIGRNMLKMEPGIKESGRYKRYMDVIRTGKPFFGEDLYHHPGGDLHLTVSAFKVGDGLGIISTDVTERRRSEEELRSRKEELEKRTNQLLALQKVTTSLQSTLELKEVLQQVAEGVTANLGYDHSFIMVLDEKEESLKGTVFSTGDKWQGRVGELAQAMGLPLEEVKVPLVKGYSHAVDEGLEGRAVVAHSLCEIAEPPLSREACTAAWKLLESKTAVTLPIMAMERQVGAILAFTGSADITDVDLEPLRILADQAGVAIVNATIYQGAAEIAQRLAVIGTLSRIVGSSMDIKEVYQAFTDEIKDVIDFDHASIATVEGEQLRFSAVSSVSDTAIGDGTVVSLAGSATGWVVNNRRTNIEDDFAVERLFPIDDTYFEEGLRSAIRVPLFYKDQVFGSFNLASRQPNAYGDRERGILEQVAGPIAAAVENSRLFIQVKEHEEQLVKAYDELKTAQDYMVRSERLRALGEMAGGVAHDFNNILAIVLGRAQLALEDVKDEKLKRDLQIIEQTAIDAASTVRRLQDFARVRVDRVFEEVDVNQMIAGAVDMVQSRQMELKERQGIVIDIDTALGKIAPVLGSASELREALVNILFNSMDAMPQGGRIEIKSRLDGKSVALSISDDGVGMSEETRARIFEPFFTTRAPRGSGLGLAVTYGIITRHGGRIEVESSEDKGTTFNIRLPVSSGGAVAKKAEPKAAAVENARILLVDDDVEVGQVLDLMLKQLGHRVTAVNTGEAAVNTFEMGEYDLVITDLGMPDMPGSDVARAVKDIRPGTPVLLITGWGVQLDREELPEVDGVVAKPFSKDTLSQQLSELLAPKKSKKRKKK